MKYFCATTKTTETEEKKHYHHQQTDRGLEKFHFHIFTYLIEKINMCGQNAKIKSTDPIIHRIDKRKKR